MDLTLSSDDANTLKSFLSLPSYDPSWTALGENIKVLYFHTSFKFNRLIVRYYVVKPFQSPHYPTYLAIIPSI